MTRIQLTDALMAGRLILVGKLVAIRLDEDRASDISSGDSVANRSVIYAVDIGTPPSTILIWRNPDFEACGHEPNLELPTGRLYAFHLWRFNKRGFKGIWTLNRDPDPID